MNMIVIEELRAQIAAQAQGIQNLEQQEAEELADAIEVGERLGVEVTNHRGARELRWLVDHLGSEAVGDAAACIAGDRAAYPLNVARVLEVKLPASLAVAAGTELEVSRARLIFIRLHARLRAEGVQS